MGKSEKFIEKYLDYSGAEILAVVGFGLALFLLFGFRFVYYHFSHPNLVWVYFAILIMTFFYFIYVRVNGFPNHIYRIILAAFLLGWMPYEYSFSYISEIFTSSTDGLDLNTEAKSTTLSFVINLFMFPLLNLIVLCFTFLIKEKR